MFHLTVALSLVSAGLVLGIIKNTVSREVEWECHRERDERFSGALPHCVKYLNPLLFVHTNGN